MSNQLDKTKELCTKCLHFRKNVYPFCVLRPYDYQDPLQKRIVGWLRSTDEYNCPGFGQQGPNIRNFYGVNKDGKEVKFRLYPYSYYGMGEWLWHYWIESDEFIESGGKRRVAHMIAAQPYEEMKSFVEKVHGLEDVKEIVGEWIGWSVPPGGK